MIDFLFVVESPLRELRSVLLICEELKSRGYSAEYVLGGKDRKGEKPRVIISNTILLREEIINGILKYNFRIKKVVNLLWEQALTKDAIGKRVSIMCKTANSFNYMLWQKNDYFEETLQEKVDSRRLFVTGPIAFDFLRDEFQEMYKSSNTIKQEYGIEANQKVFLFVSSFAHANPSKEAIEIAKLYDSIDDINRFYEYDRKTKNILLDWFERLIQDNPNITVVYRTHPRMNECDRVKELNSNNSRFKWICDDSLQQWIKVADYIATVYSTSIAECTVAKKKCMVLRPFANPPELDVCFYDGLHEVKDYSDFCEQIENNGGEYANNLEEKYDINEEMPSYKRMADALIEIRNSRSNNISWDFKDWLFCAKAYVKQRWNIGNIYILFQELCGKRNVEKELEMIEGIDVTGTREIVKNVINSVFEKGKNDKECI